MIYPGLLIAILEALLIIWIWFTDALKVFLMM